MSAPWWDTRAVETFRDVAGRYMAFLDGREGLPNALLLQFMHSMLPALYATALALPIRPDTALGEPLEEASEAGRQSPEAEEAELAKHHARWSALHDSLAQQLGDRWDSYREVFDPYGDPGEEPVIGSLADDLSDTYLELGRGFELWNAGRHEEAVWEWRFGFERHWSEHVTGALRAIRTLATDYGLGFARFASPDV
jgi:hypothetical protein